MDEIDVVKRAFTKFYNKLTEALPMDDLLAEFSASKLLSGNHKNTLESLSTQKEKTQYFLDEVINPGLNIGYTGQFNKMINVMESSDDPVVKYLVKQIQEYVLDVSPSNDDNGM